MKDFIAGVLIILFVGVIGLFAMVSFFEYPNAPLDLHQIAPLPVACAGYSCVTYRELSETMRKNSQSSYEKALSSLLFQRTVSVVASYEKIRITKEDSEQAMNSIEKTLTAIPGGTRVLNETYGNNFKDIAKKDILSLLQRAKMQALGISSPWESKYTPSITVWNRFLRWDENGKSIVRK